MEPTAASQDRELVARALASAAAIGLRRVAAFWFLVFSAMLLLWGQLVAHASERADGRALALVGWNMLGVGVVGSLVMPISGFWSVIALAPLVLREGRRLRGEACA